MDEKTFYQQCAISAMQGLQEGGHMIGIAADIFADELAKRSFDIAEAMVREYLRRKGFFPQN